MTTQAGNIVTVNTGSSSIKLVVFAAAHHTHELSPWLTLSISNIGQAESKMYIQQAYNSSQTTVISAPSHTAASHILIEHLAQVVAPHTIAAIGHRLVHGGTAYVNPTVIKDISEADWQLLSQLDPEHTPAAHQLISLFEQHYPATVQIACFDTAFFHDLPHVAKVLAIPQRFYDQGVRRYGFHGLSYTSLLAKFGLEAGETAMHGRVIMAHLGSGASLAATHKGKPVDTTMSLTPTSGIIMSARSGDLDPTMFSFLHKLSGISIDEFNHMVSFESGLLGVSQLTGDMQALLKAEKQNTQAATAVELFVRDVKKSIGALAALLGGVDSLLFSGGIGEQAAGLRARICQGLDYMGIELNEDANARHNFLISSEHSKVGVHVITTDEAEVIAKQTQETLAKLQGDTYE